MVLPKLTATGVSGMGFTAIKTISSMRARFPICSRWHRWHMVRLTLAASCKGTMVIFAVRTHANWAHHTEGAAVVEVVTQATATGTVRHTDVRGCLTEEANKPSNIERAIDESLHPGPLLRVPDVKEDSTRVRTTEIANDPRWSSKTNVVFKDSGKKDALSIHRCGVSALRCNEGDTDKFAKGPGGRNLAINCSTLGGNATHEGLNPSKLRRDRNARGGEREPPIPQTKGSDHQAALKRVDETRDLWTQSQESV